MPKGTYDLNSMEARLRGAGADRSPIDADLTIEVAVAALPEEDPDAAWQM